MEQEQISGLRRAMSTAIPTTSTASFGLRGVANSYLGGGRLFDSDGDSTSGSTHFAPVVSLGSGIQVKSGSGTESDPYVIGK